MKEEDREILSKLEKEVQGGLNDSGAVQFLALLSVTEYDRLINFFKEGTDTGVSEQMRFKLVAILQKLREAKGGRSS